MFQYEVDVYEAPNRIVFHQKQVMMNDKLDKYFRPLIDKTGVTFEYAISEIDKKTTKWERNVHFYHFGGFFTKMFFFIFMKKILRSQKKGAALYVQYVKQFLECDDYKIELYGEYRKNY